MSDFLTIGGIFLATVAALAFLILGLSLLSAWRRDLRKVQPVTSDFRGLDGPYPNVQLWLRWLRGDVAGIRRFVGTMAYVLLGVVALVAVLGLVWLISQFASDAIDAPAWAVVMICVGIAIYYKLSEIHKVLAEILRRLK